MLTNSELLLPSLDFLLPCKCVCLQHSVNHLRKLSRTLINIVYATLIAFDLGGGIVTVSFRLGRYCEFRHLRWRFLTYDLLACALDIQDERVAGGLDVEQGVVSLAGTTAVEAKEADIEAGGIVYRVEALCAVFPVDSLRRSWWFEFRCVDVLTSHIYEL